MVPNIEDARGLARKALWFFIPDMGYEAEQKERIRYAEEAISIYKRLGDCAPDSSNINVSKEISLLEQYITAIKAHQEANRMYDSYSASESNQRCILNSLDSGGHTGYNYSPIYSSGMDLELETLRETSDQQEEIRKEMREIIGPLISDSQVKANNLELMHKLLHDLFLSLK